MSDGQPDYKPHFGCWVDDSVKMVRSAEFWDRFKDVYGDNSTAALFIDTFDPLWDSRYTVEDLRIISHRAVVERDVELVLTFVPTPHRAILKETFTDLDVFCGESGASGVEPDVEGLYLEAVAKQYGWTIRDAKLKLLDWLLLIKIKHDVRIEVTTHPAHPEGNEKAIVTSSDIVDRILWQVYATRHDWQHRVVDWNGRYGPHGRANADVPRLANLAKKWGKKICFGQAAWDTLWPGHTVDEAMTIVSDAYLQYQPVEIRDWSSGRTIGRFRNDGCNPDIIAYRKKMVQAFA